jgi:biopolymer transport protein ExbD
VLSWTVRPDFAIQENCNVPISTPHEELPGLNMMPMIDYLLLLNIFFIASSRLVEPEKQYDINLPTVTAAKPLTALPDEIILNVQADGTIIVKGKQVALDDLEEDLHQSVKRYAEQVVRIRGDGVGPYQHVMSALSLCQKAGISKIKLDARIEESSTP